MMLLAIDPGIDTGWAWYVDTHLVECGVSNPRQHECRPTDVIIEKPQIYSLQKSKGDPNDLITLAIQVGEYKEFYQSRKACVDTVLPRTWKGQVPKDIHHARTFAWLTPAEQEVVSRCGKRVPARIRHNMMDAVALGLWHLKRTRVGGT